MASKLTRVSFSSKGFLSNQQVIFRVYDKNNNLIHTAQANEWANTGVYYLEGNLTFTNHGDESYLVVAEEINGNWKAHRTITKNSEFIID